MAKNSRGKSPNHQGVGDTVSLKHHHFNLRMFEVIAVGLLIFVAGVIFLNDVFGIQGGKESIDSYQPFGGQRVGVSVVLSAVEGDVQVYQGSTDSEMLWRPAEVGVIIKEGDTIRTGSGAKALVELTDGSAFRMNADSEISLTKADTMSFLVNQIRGEIYYRVAKSGSCSYVARINGVDVVSQGSAFNVMKLSDQAVEIKVIESSVAVSVLNEQVITNVMAGDMLLVTAEETGVTRKRFTTRDDDFDTPWFEYVITAESAQNKNLGILGN